MSAGRDRMIKAIKEYFIPEIRKRNFKGSFPHFRKTENGKTNLLTFQFDRDGGGFIIELANWNEPEFKTHWGKKISLNKLRAHDLGKRQRIYPHSIIEIDGKNSWFRYDDSASHKIYDEVALKVIDRIPIMEQYWTERKIQEINKSEIPINSHEKRWFKDKFQNLFSFKKRNS